MSDEKQISLSSLHAHLLDQIYTDIHKRSQEKFTYYTLYDLTSFPLLICQKLTKAIAQGDTITNANFSEGFNGLYHSPLPSKASLLAKLCSFNGYSIWIKDIKVLLLHFHMRLMSNDIENIVLRIIDAFYNEETDKKREYHITIDEFINRSLMKNGDILGIFMAFFERFKLINEDQVNYYQTVCGMKVLREEDSNKIVHELLLSDKAKEYIQMIKQTKVIEDPFDEDNELLSTLSTFESEVSDTLSQYNTQINTTNHRRMNNNKATTTIIPSANGNNSIKETLQIPSSSIEPPSISINNQYTFTNKANPLFFGRSNNKTQSLILDYINPITHSNEKKNNEIILYRHSNKTNKVRMVKLVHINNLLFYHKYNPITREFYYKKVLNLRLLFPKVIPNIIIQNSNYTQLELQSSINNNYEVKYFFAKNEGEVKNFANELSKEQRIKDINALFEMGPQLGCGKFGKVSLVKHLINGNEYAMKIVVKNDGEHSPETFSSYQWEHDICSFLKNVSNDHIEKIYDVIETPSCFYYITEYIPYGSLKDLLLDGTLLSDNDIRDIILQMVKGITALHQYGIIHRDIKHTNTLITRGPKGRFIPKIIDFGLSKVIGLDETATERYGSLSFKAPELILGKAYSFAVDVWAMGVTAFYLLFHIFPVKATNKHMLKKKIVNMNYDDIIDPNMCVDRLLKEAIMKCLVKDPSRRYTIHRLLKFLS